MIIAAMALSSLSHGAGISIGSGAKISLGAGSIDLGCGDASIEGVFRIQSGLVSSTRHFSIPGGTVVADSGEIQMTGDWTNNGLFSPGTSQVIVQDGCATSMSALTGNTKFYEFIATSNTGKTLEVGAGTEQEFVNALTLIGMPGKPLNIRSSIEGTQAYFSLDPDGIQNIDAVDVRDNNALGGQWLAPDDPSVFQSVDTGNNINWFLNVIEQIPVPTLSPAALLALALMLLLPALRHRRVFRTHLK